MKAAGGVGVGRVGFGDGRCRTVGYFSSAFRPTSARRRRCLNLNGDGMSYGGQIDVWVMWAGERSWHH